MWIPSPPQRVIGPAAYYPLEGGGIMKEPPPSLIVAGLAEGFEEQPEDVDALIKDDPVLPDNNRTARSRLSDVVPRISCASLSS